MIYLYLFGTCFHFIYVFMIITNKYPLCQKILKSIYEYESKLNELLSLEKNEVI